MNHIKEIEFYKAPYTYQLEIDTEDQDNLVIEQCTIIGGPIKSDTDIDPDQFTDGLDDDDWVRIKEALQK